uniref:Secreted S1 protease protein n=1 Tax=Pristhesancus plagipennis TaxID=1955184 RepID=A0A2K8JSL6_PRIPG|nr:secreted S1 protease protein [Pristhesancus plagipennis]
MMNGFHLILIGVCLIGLASAIDLNIASDGKSVLLRPQTGNGRIETLWRLKANKGCKMTLGCMFRTQSCNTALIKVDIGGKISHQCPEIGQTFFNTSIKDSMTVTIENVGPNLAAYCHVKATTPYIDLPEPVIDSSEHGLPIKPKANSACRCGWSNKNTKRIVNGKEAGIHEFPFMALIMEKKTRFPFCGGSIITTRHVLTAAHCSHPYPENSLSVIVGEHDIRTVKETKATKVIHVKKIMNHEDYDNVTQTHDIAILYLEEDVPLSDQIGRICMPTPQKALNSWIKVMGWGLLKDEEQGGKASPVLHKVNLKVIDLGVCKTIYGIDATKNRQICTYNNEKDSCQGDSGGPLVTIDKSTRLFYQTAVVSYGLKCASTDPGVNTNVLHYMDWIKDTIKATKDVELCY